MLMEDGRLTESIAPAKPVVSVEELKSHLRIRTDKDNAYLKTLVAAARASAELYVGRTFVTATLEFRLDAFPPGRDPLRLPRAPLIAVSSIGYTDTSGNSQTLSSSLYTVDVNSEPGRVFPIYNESWPDTRAIEDTVLVTYTAGYGVAPADTPFQLRLALVQLAGHWYRNREPMQDKALSEIPDVGKLLLDPWRIVEVG